MKQIKICKPILTKVDDIHNSIIMKGGTLNCQLTSDVIGDSEWFHFGEPQELNVITLDHNDKIQLGDI